MLRGRLPSMEELAASRPVVIVGTHRSGTSIVANSLRSCGLFTGSRRDQNGESAFFQRLNRRLSYEAGGHWTTPRVVHESLLAIDDLDAFVAPLWLHLTGVGAVEYWGVNPTADQRSHWGWKDPRNVALLPLWNSLFPNMRIVWVRRDPRETAASLVARTDTWRSSIAGRGAGGMSAQLRNTEAVWRGRPLLADGWRTLQPESALEVTLSSDELHAEVLSAWTGPLETVHYDALVGDAQGVLSGLCAALELPGDEAAVAEAAAGVTVRSGPARVLPGATESQSVRLAALGYES